MQQVHVHSYICTQQRSVLARILKFGRVFNFPGCAPAAPVTAGIAKSRVPAMLSNIEECVVLCVTTTVYKTWAE
jgi:hypothetical protein